VLGLARLDDLRVDVPGRKLAGVDAVVQLPGLEVRVRACGLLRLGGGEVLDTLIGLEVDLDVNEAAVLEVGRGISLGVISSLEMETGEYLRFL
jgi:hypothetical protein